MRLSGVPIRMILLKARQWGGSTLIQLYIAWLQLVHLTGWYSSIVAQDKSTSYKIMEMFSKLLKEYPPFMLDLHDEDELEFGAYGRSSNDYIIKQNGKVVRDSVISIGTVLSPETIRGGDIACAHFSEVGIWSETTKWNPESIVRSVAGSILDAPYTVMIFESTANGTGNYFHKEWLRAKLPKGDQNKSQMFPMFVAWFEIDLYQKKFTSERKKREFAKWLLDNKDNPVTNGAPDAGQYYWKLLNIGASLENINWYIQKRKTFSDHADMASEFPSDDVEAFKHSGQRVLNPYQVDELMKQCRVPDYIGEVKGEFIRGAKALNGLCFLPDNTGGLYVWELPDEELTVRNRYITVLDVGGRGKTADWSDILVIDRFWMMYAGLPEVVAEWHGHIDHDLLAWKAAQLAKFYNNSLLVIESNTYETENTDGDHTEYILDQISDHYDNLYWRVPSDTIKDQKARLWGFHTNRQTKPIIIDELVRIVREKAYVEREKEACNEFLQYERKTNGSFGAVEGFHDDRLMTRAIGLYVCFNEMELPKQIDKTKSTRNEPVVKSTMNL